VASVYELEGMEVVFFGCDVCVGIAHEDANDVFCEARFGKRVVGSGEVLFDLRDNVLRRDDNGFVRRHDVDFREVAGSDGFIRRELLEL
jgi:hypothetical protein